ncbi:unnamed protein product [Cercospora beticola]|nr:unnamed protein product [Cercospora beticola]
MLTSQDSARICGSQTLKVFTTSRHGHVTQKSNNCMILDFFELVDCLHGKTAQNCICSMSPAQPAFGESEREGSHVACAIQSRQAYFGMKDLRRRPMSGLNSRKP